MRDWLVAIDRGLFLLLNRDVANPVFDWFFPLATGREFWIVPAAIAIALFVVRQRTRALIALGLALVSVAITDPLCVRVIKELVQRHRPCDSCCLVEGGRFLLGHKHSLSFPSAHAMNTFGVATLFSLLYPRRWPWFVAFAAMIGYSRVYVGVHYPFDVAAGALFGAVIGAAVYFAFDAVRRRVTRGARPASLAPPGGGDPAATDSLHASGAQTRRDP